MYKNNTYMMHIQPSYHSVLIISKWSTMARIGLVFVHPVSSHYSLEWLPNDKCKHLRSLLECMPVNNPDYTTHIPYRITVCRKLIQSELLHKAHFSGFVCCLHPENQEWLDHSQQQPQQKIMFSEEYKPVDHLSNTQTWPCTLIFWFWHYVHWSN